MTMSEAPPNVVLENTAEGPMEYETDAAGGGISSIARIALLAESATYTVNPSAQMPDGPEKRAALAGPSSLPATRTEPARTSDDPVWVFTLKTALPRGRER